MLASICLVYLCKRTDILDFVKYEEITGEIKEQYQGKWYYSNLDENEKNIYLYYAVGVEKLEENIKLKIKTSMSAAQIQDSVRRALESYRYDNPEVFYLDTQYQIKIVNIGSSKIITIIPEYTEKSMEEVSRKKEEMQDAINEIKALITNNMSDYQKELIVHDYLVKKVKYYTYQNIDSIPTAMHNAYNALVKKEAVCDGISKAFQVVMNQERIDCITVSGYMDKTAHAWNIIKIQDSYYHIDITSDKNKSNEYNSKEKLSHVYFNVTDEEIMKTHKIRTEFKLPKCESEGLNYYFREDKIVVSRGNFDYDIQRIIEDSRGEELLEVRVLDNTISAEQLIQSLYNNNYNNYRSREITTISYVNIGEIYLFENNK